MKPAKSTSAKCTCTSVRSHETTPRMDTRTAAPAVFISRILVTGFARQLRWRRRRITRLAGASGGRVRPISEVCRQTERSERSKLSHPASLAIELYRPRPSSARGRSPNINLVGSMNSCIDSPSSATRTLVTVDAGRRGALVSTRTATRRRASRPTTSPSAPSPRPTRGA